MKNKFSIAMSLAVMVAMLVTSLVFAGSPSAPASQSATPTISSEYDDYPPGAIVNLFGAGWQTGEAVHIFVNDNVGSSWNYGTNVTAAEDGSIAVSFQLPNWFVATYSVTATGAMSGVVTMTFSDSVSSVAITSPSGVSPVTVTSLPATVTIAFNYSTSSSGTTAGEASVQGVASNTKSLTTGSSKSDSINVTIPAGTANGPYTIKVTVTNSFGGGANSGVDTKSNAVIVDVPSNTTAPMVTVSFPSPDGSNGWFKTSPVVGSVTASDASNVTAISCTDSASGLTQGTLVNGGTSSASRTLSVSGDDTHNITCTASDGAGNSGAASGSSNTATIKIDTVAPTILGSVSPAAAGTGWYNISTGAPTVSFVCGDTGGSGVASCTSASTLGNGENQSVTGTATDEAGNSASATVSNIDVDLAAPTISANISPAASGTGWYNTSTGAPTVTFTCNDTGSSGLTGSCPGSVTLGNGENQSVSGGPVSDAAGNSSGVATISNIDVDLDAPTISASISPETSGTGWYNISTGAPTVQFTCSDSGSSGLASCPADFTFVEGENQSHSGTAYDNAGNSASAGVSDVDVDLTAPSVSVALDRLPAGSSWFNENTGAPVAEFTCSDATSGIASCPGDYTFAEGENQSHSDTAYDNAGNSASASVSDVDVDLTDPSITWNGGPAAGGSYDFGFVPSAPTCTAVDTLSGPDVCNVAGYSNAAGPHSMTATAYDVAGNVGTANRSYSVLAWILKGFYQPVDMNGVYNVVKNGSTVPLKFEIFTQVSGVEITDVSAIQQPLVVNLVTCQVGTVEDVVETVATGGTSLRYDTTGGQFIFNWKTPAGATKCYRVTMTTQDGSFLQAFFKLK